MASNDFGRQICEKDCQALGYVTCGGCRKWLCKKHFFEHQQELTNAINNLAEQHDELRAQVMKDDNSTQALLDRIDTWEKKSIEKIHKIAEEVRADVQKHFHRTKEDFKTSLQLLCEELKKNQMAEDFTEVELEKWTKRIERFRQQLKSLSTVEILHDTDGTIGLTRWIRPKYIEWNNFQNFIDSKTRWSPSNITVAGNEEEGDQLNRLRNPNGFDVDDDGTLYIADTGNHRIVAWKTGATHGDVVAGGNGQGNGLNQLNQPEAVLVDRVHDKLVVSDTGNRRVMRWSLRDNTQNGEGLISNIVSVGLAIDDKGSLYVSDFEKHEVRRYREEDRKGVIVAGGHGRGDAANQLNCPRHLFVDRDLSLYISDRDNYRVMKWLNGAKQGFIVAGGYGQGNALNQLNSPAGVFVDSRGLIYVADQSNCCIMRWRDTACDGEVLLSRNKQLSQRNPQSLAFDREGNMYLSGYQSHRIQRHAIA